MKRVVKNFTNNATVDTNKKGIKTIVPNSIGNLDSVPEDKRFVSLTVPQYAAMKDQETFDANYADVVDELIDKAVIEDTSDDNLAIGRDRFDNKLPKNIYTTLVNEAYDDDTEENVNTDIDSILSEFFDNDDAPIIDEAKLTTEDKIARLEAEIKNINDTKTKLKKIIVPHKTISTVRQFIYQQLYKEDYTFDPAFASNKSINLKDDENGIMKSEQHPGWYVIDGHAPKKVVYHDRADRLGMFMIGSNGGGHSVLYGRMLDDFVNGLETMSYTKDTVPNDVICAFIVDGCTINTMGSVVTEPSQSVISENIVRLKYVADTFKLSTGMLNLSTSIFSKFDTKPQKSATGVLVHPVCKTMAYIDLEGVGDTDINEYLNSIGIDREKFLSLLDDGRKKLAQIFYDKLDAQVDRKIAVKQKKIDELKNKQELSADNIETNIDNDIELDVDTDDFTESFIGRYLRENFDDDQEETIHSNFIHRNDDDSQVLTELTEDVGSEIIIECSQDFPKDFSDGLTVNEVITQLSKFDNNKVVTVMTDNGNLVKINKIYEY